MYESTLILKRKYSYFNHLLIFERFEFFVQYVYEETIDHYIQMLDADKLYDNRIFVMYFHNDIMCYWRKFQRNRNRLMKTFLEKRKILKRQAYYNILINYFCYDLTHLIIDFML